MHLDFGCGSFMMRSLPVGTVASAQRITDHYAINGKEIALLNTNIKSYILTKYNIYERERCIWWRIFFNDGGEQWI